VSISCLFRLAESCLGVKFARLDTTTRHFLAFGPVLNSLDGADRSRLSTPLVVECILMLAGRVPLMFLMCSHVTPLVVLSVRLSDDRALAADHDYLSLSLSRLLRLLIVQSRVDSERVQGTSPRRVRWFVHRPIAIRESERVLADRATRAAVINFEKSSKLPSRDTSAISRRVLDESRDSIDFRLPAQNSRDASHTDTARRLRSSGEARWWALPPFPCRPLRSGVSRRFPSSRDIGVGTRHPTADLSPEKRSCARSMCAARIESRLSINIRRG